MANGFPAPNVRGSVRNGAAFGAGKANDKKWELDAVAAFANRAVRRAPKARRFRAPKPLSRPQPVASASRCPKKQSTKFQLAHHVGILAELEDEQCRFSPSEAFDGSPNRLDAEVWAHTELMLGEARASLATDLGPMPTRRW